MKNDEILKITKKFHDTYEKLSKEYDYETRKETKVFNINSNNGKLMYATVNEMVNPILKENEQLKDNWSKLKEWLNNFHKLSEFEQRKIVNKMQEIEKESDNNDEPFYFSLPDGM